MARKKAAPTNEPPQTIKIADANWAELLAHNAAQLAEYAAEYAAKARAVAKELGNQGKPVEDFWLAPVQRDVLLSVPEISMTIKAKLKKAKSAFTVAEVASMTLALAEASTEGDAQKQFAMLLVARHLTERLQAGTAGTAEPKTRKTKEPRAKPGPNTIYQFKITLVGSKPPIWRRIQVADCTLDKLHEHIQTAMGWTNSHLHHFRLGEQLYGDPLLMEENMEEMNYRDSTRTKISKIVPKAGNRFSFTYEYDFGDGWEHEVLFEGWPKKEPGTEYPLCLEGARACPPEDVGGIDGFHEFLEARDDPTHEEHEDVIEWGGNFDAEKFDPVTATEEMKKGLPDWRAEI